MEFERTALLGAIDTIKPALATKEIIEELLYVWFDGATATAYNDASLGIQVPLKTDFKGGIRGSILLGILAASRVKDVTVEAAPDGNAILKCGATKLDLALFPPERSVWEFPPSKKNRGFSFSDELRDALKRVMLASGSSAAVPDQLGVTFMLDGKEVHLFCHDSRSVAWEIIDRPEGLSLGQAKRITIPTPFLEQLLRLGDDKAEVYLGEDGVIAKLTDGTKIFARLVDVPKPQDFNRIVDDNYPDDEKLIVPIPKRLALSLDRAAIILATAAKDEYSSLKVKGDFLTLYTKSPAGELKDTMKLDAPVPDVDCRIDPSLLKRALPHCDRLAFSKGSVMLLGAGFTYFVGVRH